MRQKAGARALDKEIHLHPSAEHPGVADSTLEEETLQPFEAFLCSMK